MLHLCAALGKYFDITLLAPMGDGARPQETLSGVHVERYRYAPFQAWETLAYPGGIMPRLRRQPWRWAQVPFLMLGQMRAVRRLHAECQFDLIHAHWLVPQGLAALMALTGRKRPPLVVTSHGGDLHTLAHSRLAFLLRWVLARSQGLTTVSPLLAENAKALQTEPMDNAAIIPMGVDVATFSGAARTASSANMDEQMLRLLFVGRLAEKKGLRYLLDALDRSPLSGQRVMLQIAGDGPLAGELRAQAEMLDLGAKVQFLGGVAYREVPGLMAAADMVVVPSVEAADGDCDGLPTVILEAMAARSLVVSTPVGGIRQVLDDGQTGRLVPPKDADALAGAISALIDDPQARQQMVANAFERVQGYDWSVIARRYADVLNLALQRDD